MKLLIVSATQKEVGPTLDWLESKAKVISAYRYKLDELDIDVLISGVGIANNIYALMKYLRHNEIDHLLNAGIAGAFDHTVPLGETFLVHRQRFGDLGVQQADGSFEDVYQSQLSDPNAPPLNDGWLEVPDTIPQEFLPHASSITVNKVLGHSENIQEMIDKYDPDLASMEGAAVAFVCLQEDIPYMEIRSVSNHIKARKKEDWDIPLAINELNNNLQSILNSWKNIAGDRPFPAQ
jgi:futalosine hydrolase